MHERSKQKWSDKSADFHTSNLFSTSPSTRTSHNGEPRGNAHFVQERAQVALQPVPGTKISPRDQKLYESSP